MNRITHDSASTWAHQTSLELEHWYGEDISPVDDQQAQRQWPNSAANGRRTDMRGLVNTANADSFAPADGATISLDALESMIERAVEVSLTKYFPNPAVNTQEASAPVSHGRSISLPAAALNLRNSIRRSTRLQFGPRAGIPLPESQLPLNMMSEVSLRPEARYDGEKRDLERAPPEPIQPAAPVATPPPSEVTARSILVGIGGFFVFFASFGLLTSFGKFQTFYTTTLLAGTPPSTIAWIGSTQFFTLFISGLLLGPLFDRYGARRLSIPGTFIYVLALMLASISTQFWHLMLTQGFLLGFGCALHFYPTTASVSQRFSKHRGTAMGLVATGSSIGGIVWPIMVNSLLGSVGFGWTMRICGFLALALLIIANVLVVERKELRGMGAKAKAVMQASGTSIKFAELRYVLFTAGFFFVYFGLFIPYYFLPAYGLLQGMSSSMAAYLVVILNAGSFIGRAGIGYASDKLGRFNMTFMCSLLAGVILATLNTAVQPSTIIVFAVFYGIFSGALLSLPPTCLAQITPHPSMIGVKLGVAMAVCSLGLLTGSPIGGALLQHANGQFDGLIAFSTTVVLFGSMLVLAARYVADRRIVAAF